MFEDKHIILASSSSRRKYLLEQAGIAFTVKKKDVDEIYPEDMPVRRVPLFLARKKALATQQMCDLNELILAADTIVLQEDTIFGKPESKKDAARILQILSGKMHEVITSVCLLKGRKLRTISEVTSVFFRELTPEQIDYYVENYNPMDKAGAYAIQEWIGLVGIKKIEGDYFNVVGLPVGRVIEEIRLFDEA